MTKITYNQDGTLDKIVHYDLPKGQQFIAMGQMMLAYEAIQQFFAKVNK